MGLGERVKSRVVESAALRLYQWRGDPVARLMLPATKADPYPLYAQLRQRGLVRSPLGLFAAADHATVASILRDRRFSSSPVHQRGYRPPSYPPGDPRAGLPAADLLTMDPPDHTRLIGNGTVALLGDPDSRNRLRQDPALVPAAIEEMLRYDSPVQLTSCCAASRAFPSAPGRRHRGPPPSAGRRWHPPPAVATGRRLAIVPGAACATAGCPPGSGSCVPAAASVCSVSVGFPG